MNFNDIVSVVDKYGREYVKIEKKDGTVLWELSVDNSDYLVVTMRTTMKDEEVKLCLNNGYLDNIDEIVVDGEVIDKTITYVFEKIGEHEVKYKFMNNEIPEPSSGAYGLLYMNSNVVKAVVGDNITYVGNYAFYYCTNLESFILGNGVRQIKMHSLEGCSNLTDVVFGENMKFIGTFAMENCKSLNNMTLKYNGVVEVNTFAGDPIYGAPSKMNVYVPAEQVERYKIDTYWKTRASYIQPIM